MSENNFLAERFEANRAHLRAVAYRMLGSRSEAEDAVQEAWLRLGRADTGDIKNLGGWLTTVVARICLDMLRARKSRREEQMGPHVPEPTADNENGEQEIADSIGAALLIVLDTLSPVERLAFGFQVRDGRTVHRERQRARDDRAGVGQSGDQFGADG